MDRQKGIMSAKTDVVEKVSDLAGRATGQAQALADRAVPEEERGLIRRAMDLPLRKKLALARRLWRDPRMSAYARAPLIAGLAYAVLPIKLTPKWLGPLREAEKIAGLALLLWLLVRLAPRDAVQEHLDALDKPGLWSRIRGRG
jgi:uncharacterized membrane protein YkvA (DUF1232 family)